MKLKLKSGKRFLTAVLALALLCSGVLQNVTVSATAAPDGPEMYDNVYEYIAEHCYNDQPVAKEILESGALQGSQHQYPVERPYAELLSVKNGKLVAGRCPVYGADGRVHSIWEPITYTVAGTRGSFPAASGIEETVSTGDLGLDGILRVEVLYRMIANISAADLYLPATLAEEAADQLTVLNHLVSPEKPYKEYMEQMSDSQMQTLYDVLDPEYEFASLVKLNRDKKKNTALKHSFREVISEMRGDCYRADGTLTFFDLLCSYETYGLLHYYQNGDEYQSEIYKLNRHLNALLAEETRDGVLLTEADKEAAIEKMVSIAGQFGYIEGDVTLDFVDLRNNIDSATAKLKEPNEKINLYDKAKLSVLVNILETKATVEGSVKPGDTEGVVWWEPTVTKYGKSSVVQEYTVALDLDFNASGDGTGDGTGGDGSDDNTSGDTGDNPDDNTGDNTGDNAGGNADGYGSVLYVGTESSLKKNMANAGKDDTVCVLSDVTMTEDVSVNSSIKVTGADRLNEAGHMLVLATPGAAIAADAPLNVASGIDGYVPVKAKTSNTYSLAEVRNPETGGKTAGSKTEVLNHTRYLYLDLDPVNGMTLDAFRASTAFSQLDGYTVSITVAGNSGSALIKTADRMTVTARNGDGKVVAQISYVIIVMGDTNCNGKVNSSDAAVTKNISMGKESGVEARMAADVNFSGTAETPKVNSSDVSYIMAKWFAWDLNKYVSNLK